MDKSTGQVLVPSPFSMANPHALAAIRKNRFMPAPGSGFAGPGMTKNLIASKNQAMPRPGFA
jgi:hypothetical protein